MSSSIIRASKYVHSIVSLNSIHRFPQSEEHILRSLEFGVGVFHGFSLIFFFFFFFGGAEQLQLGI